MTELYPSDAELNALSGTTDSEQEVVFPSIYEAPYYTTFYKMLHGLLNVSRRAGDLRVFQDGSITFGVRAGVFLDGDSVVNYAGAAEQSLTDNATNYVFLTAAGTLTKNTTGFPDPSTLPHIRLGAIVTGSGTISSIIDYRGMAFLTTSSAMTAANANTLVGGETADSLHTHDTAGLADAAVETAKINDNAVTAAKLASSLQDMIPQITLTGTDDADGTGSMAIQVKDAAANNLAERFRIRAWIADAEFSEPDPQTDFSVTTGEQLREIEADADYEVITDTTGLAIMNIDAATDKTVYVMAEIDGRIYSGSVAITGN